MRDFDDSRTAPDAIVPVVGYRLWEVRGDKLCSLWLSAILWTPQQKIRADCYEPQGTFASTVLGRDCPLHAAPDPHCRCGIYATSDPEHLPRSWSGTKQVVVCGAVGLWGRVVVGERGWRGEFARPLVLSYEEPWGLYGKLAVSDQDWRRFLIAAVARSYGLPVLPGILDAHAAAREVLRNPGISRAA